MITNIRLKRPIFLNIYNFRIEFALLHLNLIIIITKAQVYFISVNLRFILDIN